MCAEPSKTARGNVGFGGGGVESPMDYEKGSRYVGVSIPKNFSLLIILCVSIMNTLPTIASLHCHQTRAGQLSACVVVSGKSGSREPSLIPKSSHGASLIKETSPSWNPGAKLPHPVDTNRPKIRPKAQPRTTSVGFPRTLSRFACQS